MAHGYVKQSLNSLTKRSITFLCGDAGPLAVGAVVYHKMNNEKQAEDCITRSWSCIYRDRQVACAYSILPVLQTSVQLFRNITEPVSSF